VLEMEYKKNRQSVIIQGLSELSTPPPLATHGIFSQARAAQSIQKSRKQIAARLTKLKARLEKALANPPQHDPVYQTCQRIFRRDHPLVLSFDSDRKLKAKIRAKAIRRFYLGCPPRKKNDTSIGDAVNWEWMIHCAEENDAELVILTRDSDYGTAFAGKSYLNDHLKQEFQDRVSKKRTVLLYSSAVQALKHFEVKVSKETEKSEAELPPLGNVIMGLSRNAFQEVLRGGLREPLNPNSKGNPFAWLDLEEDPPGPLGNLRSEDAKDE
jgi:hypothetical protein